MGNTESGGLKQMCCNNSYCNGDADVENYEAKNQPKLADQTTVNRKAEHQRQMNNANQAGSSSYNYSMNTLNRGQTELYSNFQGGSALYEEPRVDILASSRRDQLADALGQSA